MIKQYGNTSLDLKACAELSKDELRQVLSGRLKIDFEEIWKDVQKYKPKKAKPKPKPKKEQKQAKDKEAEQ